MFLHLFCAYVMVRVRRKRHFGKGHVLAKLVIIKLDEKLNSQVCWSREISKTFRAGGPSGISVTFVGSYLMYIL